jgi:hypothetical protein
MGVQEAWASARNPDSVIVQVTSTGVGHVIDI